MAGVVIVCNSSLLRKFETEGLGLFEEHETKLEFLFLQKYHGDEVAKFTEPYRSFLVLLTMDSICIFIDVKELFVDVKSFLVLGLLL